MNWKVLENVEQSKIGRKLSRGQKWGLKGQGGGSQSQGEKSSDSQMWPIWAGCYSF